MSSQTLRSIPPPATSSARQVFFERLLPKTIIRKLAFISLIAVTVMIVLGGLLFFTTAFLNESLQTASLYNEEMQRAQGILNDIEDTANDVRAIFDNNDIDSIPEVLADNEILLSEISAYRSVAEQYQLIADIDFIDENEPLLNEIRADTFLALTSYRDGDIAAAQTLIELVDRNISHLAAGFERSLTQRNGMLTDELDLVSSTQSTLLIITLLVVVLGIAILIFVSNLTYRSLDRNLKQLTSATDRISAGDYNEVLNLESGDELQQLAESFNLMAGTVISRENDLRDLNQTLENRVMERTVELKNARNEALASKRIADENSRLKSEFLSTMSHELRTPMNAIQGFMSIMLKRMAGVEYNDKAERYMKKVQSNSERLLGLINDFLDLSRIESGRLELAYLPMSPAHMMQSWYENLSVLADSKGLSFNTRIDPQLSETIYGDEESISKIAINLVGNAIKFTGQGSVTLSLQKRGDQMELQVSDTGIGIPPHARDYIFDEFRQVDQSSKREYGGTGLGLSIVQKLARLMGGTVTVQSEVGVGSTFTVLLPISTQSQDVLQGVK